MRLRMGDLRRIMQEARRGRMDTYWRLMAEAEEAGDTKSHAEGASGNSLDEQVDRYLTQYETDAKKTDGEVTAGAPSVGQMESIDWSDLVRGVVIEAGQSDKDSQGAADEAPGADQMTGADTDKMGLDTLDVAKFADDVVRLIQNYDSLLEVRNTLMRRARSFLEKNYNDEVLNSFDDVLRDDHGMEVGMDKGALDAEKFPAPAADRASGSAEPGAGGSGATS